MLDFAEERNFLFGKYRILVVDHHSYDSAFFCSCLLPVDFLIQDTWLRVERVEVLERTMHSSLIVVFTLIVVSCCSARLTCPK